MSIVSGLIDRLLAASELITLLISFGLALWLAERRALRLGLDPALISQMGFGLGLGALAGGRLAYILADWRTYARYPFDILLVQGGLSLWGAILGGGLVLVWYARRRGSARRPRHRPRSPCRRAPRAPSDRARGPDYR